MLSLNIGVYLRIWHTHWAESCPTFFFSIRAIIDPGSQFHIVVKYSFAILVNWVESGDGLVIVARFASDNQLQFMQAVWCNHNNYNLTLINYLTINLLSLNKNTLFKVLEVFFFIYWHAHCMGPGLHYMPGPPRFPKKKHNLQLQSANLCKVSLGSWPAWDPVPLPYFCPTIPCSKRGNQTSNSINIWSTCLNLQLKCS